MCLTDNKLPSGICQFLAQGASQQQEALPTGLGKGFQPLLVLKTMVKRGFHSFLDVKT